MKLRNVIMAGLMFGMTHGMSVQAGEDKITKGYNSMDAMGCMLVGDCTKDVNEVFTILDISSNYDNTEEFTPHALEFNNLLMSLNQIGSKVYLADQRYFPVGHRGVYHTVSNNFYLNKDYMNSPATLMQVMRHEGWHAAQDCMAGTIENSLIAIIKPEEEVPMVWRVLAERTYPKSAVPWEAEAGWAGRTEGMTQKALEACAAGEMWKVYEPTPLTRKWLMEEGYIDK
ncbi:hypothetical protein LIS061010_018 [Synechococcus phage S-RIM2]|uniref:Uncharacterized protein n=1 Tax=Synechococcus phage S-RIM2 TaxID=687800 RepID=A0A1D7S7B9_9CAUD|nr:hypothetical protein LIS011010_018 [Synechococcus phage S-RIM2]AON98607.1 hypothetical protein LIS061010_018 [Synechococcus phage S-RIM2]AON99680.1 hypothetical protein NJ_05_1013_018 [Synechococcus phage S-RIM2]AOO01605.1 hypothetical protein Np140912_018 [Synechococcus phage S-RIM2]AOO03958.1 hypothetical protein RW020113_018 [Synechococcus phage S-RIM2]